MPVRNADFLDSVHILKTWILLFIFSLNSRNSAVMVTEMAIKYLVLEITVFITLINCTSSAQNGVHSLHLGDTLAVNQIIVSKNGTFELGFFCPNGMNDWYVGIWSAQMSPKIVVWVANRDNPVKDIFGFLNFSSDGRLRLFDMNGQSVWSTDNDPKGSRAMITDSGNFIMLGDGQNNSEIVWESFAHPGDTWLPGMHLWTGMKITSWKSSTDPASGLFSLEPDPSPEKTELVMNYNSSVRYYSSGEWTGSYFAKNPEGELYLDRYEFSSVRVSPSRYYFHIRIIPWEHVKTGLVRLDENGELRVYFGIDDGTWSQAWQTYRGQCSDYDICGSYGLCNPNDVCSCVEGFSPKNDSQGWWSTGCTRRKPLQCSPKAGTTDGFFEAKNRSMPEERAVSYNNTPTMQGCRTACLHNCSCTAFAFVISGQRPVCRLWFGDLFKMDVSSDSQSIFIRLAASDFPIATSNRSRKSPALVFILLPSASAFSTVLLLVTFILWKRGTLQKKSVLEEDVPIMLKTFTYRELRIASENFKHKLGNGAFGSVFRGTLSNGTLVAVKRLKGSAGVEKQFRAEINTIGNIQHVNLVRLYGFCVEGSQRLLVYACMPNGSLNSSLFNEGEKAEKVLDWRTRFQIALGTARGLVYLHEECRDQIIHCHIKPENILLDDDFKPTIADFGLAKMVGRDFSRVLTTTRGTPGYLAPEWLSGLPITPKVDVYSFGMMLMEIISGRRNLDLTVEERSRLYFPTWASSQIERGNMIGVVDARIATETNVDEVRRALVVGQLCIQENEEKRPSMGEVVKMLEGRMEAPVPQMLRSLQAEDDDNSDDFVTMLAF